MNIQEEKTRIADVLVFLFYELTRTNDLHCRIRKSGLHVESAFIAG